MMVIDFNLDHISTFLLAEQLAEREDLSERDILSRIKWQKSITVSNEELGLESDIMSIDIILQEKLRNLQI
jgi:hypothetical protein